MRYLLPMLLYIGLTAYVIADIAQHRDEEPYRLPKVLWVLIVLFAPYVGALAWLVARWSNPSRPSRSSGYRAPNPDDDPAFRVWLIEQERRKRQEGGER
jgi:phage shock protein PspC (stress-responsive transcriptional regulator)